LAVARAAGASKAELDRLKGTYEIDITTVYKSIYISQTAPQDIKQGLAKGGIRTRGGGIRHAAVGLLIPPSNPGTILAGEPKTGGELLSPLRGGNRWQMFRHARMLGDRYGFDVVPRAARLAHL